MDIREKYAWTKQAWDISDGLENFPSNSKIAVIIRHSQRNEPTLITASDLNESNMELTPLGYDVASKFGESLPKNRFIRLFHSPIKRYKETAQMILEGFTNIGGKGDFVGDCDSLFGIGINPQSILDELNKYKDYQVVLRYLAGIYTPDLFPPALPFYQKSGKKILELIDEGQENGIDIFVSHDFHTMVFKFGWFGIPPNEEAVNYLGGFAFSTEKDCILLLDNGELIKLGVPYWWNNKPNDIC